MYVMKQFSLVVKCCPGTEIPSDASPIPDAMLPAINNSCLEDDVVKSVMNTVEVHYSQLYHVILVARVRFNI